MAHAFENKQIIVTGGIGGLGQAVVSAFVDSGATVHIPNFDAAVPDWFELAANDRVHITNAVDLTDEAAVAAYYDAVPHVWASIHLAGGFAMANIADTAVDDLMRMFRMNTLTCFLCCREAVKAMRKGDGGGRIVNVSARPAVAPVAGMTSYLLSKAAVAALTQGLAAELTNEGILVNAILPSIIDTAANRKAMPDADHDAWPKPAQLAETISFLASPANQVTSGALVPVYGNA